MSSFISIVNIGIIYSKKNNMFGFHDNNNYWLAYIIVLNLLYNRAFFITKTSISWILFYYIPFNIHFLLSYVQFISI